MRAFLERLGGFKKNASYVTRHSTAVKHSSPKSILASILIFLILLVAVVGTVIFSRASQRSQAPEPSQAQTTGAKPLRVIELIYAPRGDLGGNPYPVPECKDMPRSDPGNVLFHPDCTSAVMQENIERGSRYKGGPPILDVQVVDRIVNVGRSSPRTTGADPGATWYYSLASMLEENNLCDRIREEQIDQIWFFKDVAGPDGSLYDNGGFNLEHHLSSKYAIYSGAQYSGLPVLCNGERGFSVQSIDMNRNPSLEAYGHFAESLMETVQGRELFWDRWAGKTYTPGYVGAFPSWALCGNDHFPPNTSGEYNYRDEYDISNNFCNDWHPDGTGAVQTFDCWAWQCRGDEYFVWWLQKMPGRNNGLRYQQKPLPPWQEFFADLDRTIEYYLNQPVWLNPALYTLSVPTSYNASISGTQTSFAGPATSGGTTGLNTNADTQVLQSSTYGNFVLLSAAYRAAINTTASISSATYCGQAMTRLGTRVKYQHQTVEQWYIRKPPPPPTGKSSCTIVVNFSADPEDRVLIAALFNNVDQVAPVESYNTGGFGYPPGSTSFQMSKSGPKDSIYLCTYSNYPAGGYNNITPQLTNWRVIKSTNGLVNAHVQTALSASNQRRNVGEVMTMRWTAKQAFPWAGLCANIRVKPFTQPTPLPTFVPPPPSATPTPTPLATSTPTPKPTSTPTPSPTPTSGSGGLPFSVDLKLNNSDGPVIVTAGQTATLSWTINGSMTCTANGAWSGTKTSSGSQSVTIPSTIPGSYGLTCKGVWGITTDTVSFAKSTSGAYNVGGLVLRANGSRGPITLSAGSSVTISWKPDTGITFRSCTASGAWTGRKTPGGGTQTIKRLTAGNKVFTLGCVYNGATYNHRVFVNVESPGALPPTAPVSGANGLLQKFYTGRTFNTLYNTQTVNGFPDFDWGSSGAIPGSPRGAGAITNDYSARWTAQIFPEETAEHTFYATIDDGVRLWVGDRLIIDSFTFGGRRVLTGKINLIAGRPYPFRLEYFESTGDAVMILTAGNSYSGGGPAGFYMTSTDTTSLSIWNLNEGSGTLAQDTGTLSAYGTVYGSPTRNSTCRLSGCINFDGVNDYVAMGDKNDMIGNQMTLSAWVNVPAHKNYNFIINKLASYGNYRLYMDLSGKVRFGIRNRANGYQEQIATTALAVNKWNHVAVTFNQTTKTSTIYLNGVAAGSKTDFTLIRGDTTQPLEIGRGGRYYFKGMIDEVRMYPRLLTQTELTNLYNGQDVK